MKIPKHPPNHKPLQRYAYYSGLGFQMIAIIGIFTYLGHRLDQGAGSENRLWTVMFSLIGVCVSLYLVIRSVIRKK